MTTDEKRRATLAEREAWAIRSAQIHAEVAFAVLGNRCPDCGRGVHRNLALTGWWQCDAYGAPDRRRDPNGPGCSWQGFTQ